jgi:hypothetical protein
MPQATRNAVISCIHTAHTKYESNLLDWQRVVEINYHLFTRQDMDRFQEKCEDGLLGPRDYGIFKNWLAIDRSRDGYICIRDGLVLEGEIQEMNKEENYYDKGPYQARVCGFFLVFHQVLAYYWWLLFRLTDLELYRKFEVSLVGVMYIPHLLISFVLMERSFSIVTCIRQA